MADNETDALERIEAALRIAESEEVKFAYRELVRIAGADKEYEAFQALVEAIKICSILAAVDKRERLSISGLSIRARELLQAAKHHRTIYANPQALKAVELAARDYYDERKERKGSKRHGRPRDYMGAFTCHLLAELFKLFIGPKRSAPAVIGALMRVTRPGKGDDRWSPGYVRLLLSTRPNRNTAKAYSRAASELIRKDIRPVSSRDALAKIAKLTKDIPGKEGD